MSVTSEFPALDEVPRKYAALTLIGGAWAISVLALIIFQGKTDGTILWTEISVVSLWHSVLQTMAHVIVPRLFLPSKGKFEERVLKTLCSALILLNLLLPNSHVFPIMQRLPALAAAYSSGAVIVGARVATLIAEDKKDKRHWNGWYFTFYICGLGWHDIDTARRIASSERQAALAKKAVTKFLLAVLCGSTAAAVLHLGSPWDAGHSMWHIARLMCGNVLILAFFFMFDGMASIIYILLCNFEVDSIFGDFSRFQTLRSFWAKYWNQPVAKMLARGVYRPALPLIGPDLSKLAVFFVSGLGHVYSLHCTNSPLWIQLSMLSFFMLQIPCLLVEDLLQLRSRVFVFASLCVTSPLFIEPLLQIAGF